MKRIENLNLFHKKILIRLDFNVPLNAERKITDFHRIYQALPTIQKVIDSKTICILCSHLGDPKEKKSNYSLKTIQPDLEKILNKKIIFVEDFLAQDFQNQLKNAEIGTIFLLENLRFYVQEKKNDAEFAKQLASLADIVIEESFSVSHRSHASIEKLPLYAKEVAIGENMAREIEQATKLLHAPKPFVVLLGGSKIGTKIKTLEIFLELADILAIAGGMVNAFIVAEGGKIGAAKVENTEVEFAKNLLVQADKKGKKIILPLYSLAADAFSEQANTKIVPSMEIPEEFYALDVAEESLDAYKNMLKNAKTILWNGPLGVFEWKKFEQSTKIWISYLIEAKKNGAEVIVGGGDSVAALEKFNAKEKMSYVSTAGGALFTFIEKQGKLPGILALEQKENLILEN